MCLCGVIYKLRLKVHVPQHVVCSDSTSPPSHGGDEQRSFSQVSPSIILHPPVACTGINTHIAQVGPFGEQASRGLKVIKWAMVVIAEYARVQLLSRERHMKIGSLKKKRKRKKIITSWKRYYMSWPSLCFFYLYTSFTAFSKTLVFLHLLDLLFCCCCYFLFPAFDFKDCVFLYNTQHGRNLFLLCPNEYDNNQHSLDAHGNKCWKE